MIEPTKAQIAAGLAMYDSIWRSGHTCHTATEVVTFILRAGLNADVTIDAHGWAESMFDGCVEVRTAGGFGLADLKNYPL